MSKPYRFLISGGGTGGHIFPALSIADALRRRFPDCEILFVGAENRMEMERVPAACYKIEGLPVAGFDRKRLWRNFGVLIKLYRSLRKARRLVREFKPDMAIGVGGYASGPVLKAAQKAGVPTVLQEQNSFAGVTNKLLAKKALAICTAYPDMEKFFPAQVITITGNPVRKQLFDNHQSQAEAKISLGFDPARPLVLAVGGSLGARTINNVFIDAVEKGQIASAPFSLMWQTGKIQDGQVQALLADKNFPHVKAAPFISDMATAYRAADLVVARAGAGTISELELLGKPAILVPSPNVAEDHQRHNAEALSTRGAAVMILDADAPASLWDTLSSTVMNSETLGNLSSEIMKLALPESDEKIVNVIENILKNRQ